MTFDPSRSGPFSEPRSDFLMAVGYGQRPGYRRVTALGNNPDVDTTGAEDVWTGGGTYPWMASATALEVVGGANDTAAGTGARTIRIDGLTAAWVEVSQTITLNGATPVSIPTSLYRINGALIMSAGTGKVNAADITIRDAGAGTTRCVIPAGYGITRQSIYTVPAGHTLQIISQLFCVNRQAGVGRFATFATFVQTSAGIYRMPLELSIGDEPPYRHDGAPGLMLPEKTDFCHRCTAVSADNTDITAAWLGVLKDNTVN